MKDTLMYKEIYESVDKITDCYEYNKETIKELAKIVKEFNPSNIIINARGTSLHAGHYAKYLLELYLGIPVSFASPSVFTIYGSTLRADKSLVISISQSGKAKDITKVVEETRTAGALTVAITNNPESITAKASEYNLHCNVGEAEAYAATKTFTSTMYLITKLAYELSGNAVINIDEKKLIECLKNALKLEEKINKITPIFKGTEDIIVLGRGLNVAIAMEFALKLRETINIHTSSYPISEFYHGPIMMCSPKRDVFIISTDKHTYKDAEEIIDKVKKMGSRTLIITNNSDLIKRSDYSIYIDNEDDFYAQFEGIIAMQLFVASICEVRDKNPDFMPELEHIDTY